MSSKKDKCSKCGKASSKLTEINTSVNDDISIKVCDDCLTKIQSGQF